MNNRIISIEKAIEEIRQGRIIIVVDDDKRENEGDFVLAAESATPEKINLMLLHGRGIMCVSLPPERCDELRLPMMCEENTSLLGTPFTVSVDLIGEGVSTGVSASDRAATIRALVDSHSTADSFGRPGHIFPLRARSEGVLERDGHTEAVYDLTRLAGLRPGGVLIEIMNLDGTMARLPQLIELANTLDINIVTIKDLIAYRRATGR